MANNAELEDVYDKIVGAFETLTGEIADVRGSAAETRAKVDSMPNEERLAAVRTELLEAQRETAKMTLDVIGERLGATREVLLSDASRSRQALKLELKELIEKAMTDTLPAHVEKIIRKREVAKAQERQERIVKLKARAQLCTSIVLFVVAVVSLALAFNGGLQKEVPAVARAADRMLN